MRRKELQCLLNRHIKYVRNCFAAVSNFQSFTIIPFALAYLAWNIHIGQKMHLYLYYTITAAGFATSAFNVKAESTVCISVHFRIGRHCEHFTDKVKNAHIGCGIASRRPADRRLINIDYLIKILNSAYTVKFA